ncbi:negative regulator of genetic competence ClpC/MecB [Catonella morbi ATCC 51271]|uniref:Negative regulator of genetic competence ClpC/MecB n=2 Tax=Catonella TaxID=43996 RepID=V2XL87_9FIRM|nr:negative regulator of genetic competence ClpC/MecB [Catonella morbi ATCC 51271]
MPHGGKMQDKFTDNAVSAIEAANSAAISLSQNYVGSEHLLIGLLSVDGVAKRVLEENGVSYDRFMELVNKLLTPGNVAVGSTEAMTPRAKRIISLAATEAYRLNSGKIGTEHILIAMLKEGDSIAVKLLNTIGVNLQKVYIDILTALGLDISQARNDYANFRNSGNNNKSKTPTLDQYSRNLTEYAREGKLDPVIGREAEIQRVIQILSRRTKNNPCIIGEPGVGKTAIAEGLAQRIVEERVPDVIRGKRVVTLDMSGMVAGSKYRGEFEERIKRVVDEVIKSGNVLLFIDEMHTIIGAGGAEGSLDASNILKPSLARGELQVIGATTREEYRKRIEKDAALERRFQPVVIEEPSEEESVLILKGLREKYEDHHKVRITDEALEAAVKLSARYINDRYLPDKAVDLMDEAASKARLMVFDSKPQSAELEKRISELETEKENAIKNEAYDKASNLKKEQNKLRQKLSELRLSEEQKKQQKVLVVDYDEIAGVVADWTKIPVNKLKQAETDRLIKLEAVLHERVIGQDEAVVAVSKAIRRGRVGFNVADRPIGSFLFLGPTGVGKTELSKALAEAMFGSENSMIRVDMSEYMEKHSVSKMIGSPPGYVGHEEGGQLSEKVRQNPYSVILFDEIEKAHPDVFNILLQVLDDGRITDSQGRMVSFKNTIIIMTSNAGAQRIITPKKLGFKAEENKEADYKLMKDGVMEEVKRIFKPEFLNRIDETIVFHTLSENELKKIVKIMLKGLATRAKEQMGLKLKFTETAVKHLANIDKEANYGARPLARKIKTEVEDLLATEVLLGHIKEGNEIKIGCKDGKIDVKLS